PRLRPRAVPARAARPAARLGDRARRRPRLRRPTGPAAMSAPRGTSTVPLGEHPRLWVNPADWVHGEFPARPDPGEDVGVRFYLGAPHAHWLGQARIPLFVSFNTLRRGH